MKQYLFFAAGVLCASSLFSQKIVEGENAKRLIPEAGMIRYTAHRASPDFIRLDDSKALSQESALTWLSGVLGMGKEESFELQRTETDRFGMVHLIYKHVYKKIPVEYSGYRLHLKDGFVTSANGQFSSNISLNTTPTLTASEATIAAKNAIGATKYLEETIAAGTPAFGGIRPVPELVIAPKNGNYQDPVFKLCWKIDVYATAPLSRNWVYVDAQTGEITWKLQRMHDTDTPGTATTVYSGSRQITADSFEDGYRLQESGRGTGIMTLNLNNTDDGSIVTDFTDADNTWGVTNPAFDQYALDAHWATEKIYDYYQTHHNRNSLDDAGFMLISLVHFSTNYGNAAWDGSQMLYGDGDGTRFNQPLTTVDVAGHEITHGLTQHTANLIYQGESGALNESFSDIFGVTIDNYARGTQGNALWRIAEECTTSGNGIRNFVNPNEFEDPDTYEGTYWADPQAEWDHGGVHCNSGVQNSWFYLMCTGGTSTNDKGDNYNVSAVGMEKAAAIAFRNLTIYLGEGSQYEDARFYAIQSAIDLFGNCSPEVIATTDAWHAVGVGEAYTGPLITASFTTTSSGNNYTFTNTSTGAIAYSWNFGDGGTSTLANPTHTYTSNGNFTVTLTATKDNCSDATTSTVTIATVGIAELDAASITVVPNPFTDELSVSLEQLAAGTELHVFVLNAIGQSVSEIFRGSVQTENPVITWKQTAEIAPGVYFIRIESGNSSITKKVIKN